MFIDIFSAHRAGGGHVVGNGAVKRFLGVIGTPSGGGDLHKHRLYMVLNALKARRDDQSVHWRVLGNPPEFANCLRC